MDENVFLTAFVYSVVYILQLILNISLLNIQNVTFGAIPILINVCELCPPDSQWPLRSMLLIH